jgi:DNA/RNA-binding domain of Phe-tRNA-synthetase-like protein
MEIEVRRGVEGIVLGIAVAKGAAVGPSRAEGRALFEAAARRWEASPEDRTEAALRKEEVRRMLRVGRYSPSGRGKPASEYLQGLLARGEVPAILDAVDAANLASLEFLLPVTLLDVDRAGTGAFLLRRGRPGEGYVFNAAGQRLELEDLLLLAALPEDRPLGTPVKDGHATKVQEGSSRLLAVVYAPPGRGALAEECARRIGGLLAGGLGCRWAAALLGPSEERVRLAV